MTIEDYLLSAVEPSRWHELLEASGSTSPFCRYSWLRLIQEAYPRWRVGLILAEQEGRLVAGLPYVSSRKLIFYQSHCLPWGTPAGVQLRNNADPEIAARLIEFWVSRNTGICKSYRLALTFPGLEAAGETRRALRAFRPRRQRSLAVPLAGRSFEQWEDSLDAAVRNQNRQAVRRGATFEEIVSPEAVPEIMQLARLTARRHGRSETALSERFYNLMLDAKGPLADEPGLGMVFMVRVNGTPAAYSVCLAHAGRLWLWDYGADSSRFDARPNNMMYRQVISLAFEQEFEVVDLGVVPEEADSLADFKRGFGGVPYERLSWVAATGLFRMAAALYRRIAR